MEYAEILEYVRGVEAALATKGRKWPNIPKPRRSNMAEPAVVICVDREISDHTATKLTNSVWINLWDSEFLGIPREAIEIRTPNAQKAAKSTQKREKARKSTRKRRKTG